MSFAEEFAKKGIAFRAVETGEVWRTKDVNVTFPGRDGGIEGKSRFVLIYQKSLFNQSALIETVSVMPITTKFGRAAMSLDLQAGEANLPERSQLKVGFIQPILKNDLDYRLGRVSQDTLDDIEAILMDNLGLLDDED